MIDMQPFDSEIMDFLANLHNISSIDDQKNCGTVSPIESTVKKRKSRSKYLVPKVFKNDIRWSYSNMFLNVLASCDVYMVYSFMKTYATPTLRDYNHLTSNSEGVIQNSVGISRMVKNWYISTCGAPDIVYRMVCPNVINHSDGTSEVSLILMVEGNFIYTKPDLPDDDNVPENEVSDDALVCQKRKLGLLLDQGKGKSRMLGPNGLRLPNYVHNEKVRVGLECLDPEDFNFLAELEALKVTSFAVQPIRAVTKGVYTMTLDTEKRIVATQFISTGTSFEPVNLSDVKL